MRRFPAISLTLCLVGCNLAGPTGTGKGGGVKVQASPSPSPSTAATATPTPAPLASEFTSSEGLVVGLDGKPAVDVPVRAFLLSDQGGAIIANNGGSVVANNGASYRLAQAAPAAIETRTDAHGRFSLKSPHGEALNVEAAQSDTVKAIALAATQTDGLKLQLAYVGSIAGKVTADGVADLSGVDVFIPGTSYVAKTDAKGQYTISNVPVGTFTLDGRRTGLGRGELKGVVVKSKEIAAAPDLPLVPVVPVISGVTPANAGPGATVTIQGDKFGASTGDTFSVAFGGATATQPKRKDDHSIEVAVPTGATTGDLTVTLDGIPSQPKPFTVLKTVAFGPNAGYLPLGWNALFPALAFDTGDKPVPDASLAWSSDAAAVTVDAKGLTRAAVAGKATLSAKSGSAAANLAITVVNEAVLCTLAGGNKLDYVDGPGTQARFKWPGAVAVDPQGTVFVADYQNNAVRAIRADGVTRTAAGGKNATFQLGSGFYTGGLAVDDKDNLYANARFKLVKLAPDGSLAEVAGGDVEGTADGKGAAARFENIAAIARDAAGNLYVAEGDDPKFKPPGSTYVSAHRIRKVTPDGTVTTLAGSVDGQQDGPAAGALFSNITSLGLDAAGNLYASDAKGIRKLTSAGQVTTLAAPAGFMPGSRIAVDAAGNIYAADFYTGLNETFIYRKIAPDGTATELAKVKGYGTSQDGPASSASDWGASGLALDPNGDLVVANYEDEADTSQVKRILLPR